MEQGKHWGSRFASGFPSFVFNASNEPLQALAASGFARKWFIAFRVIGAGFTG